MTKDEAMKLALEALEGASRYGAGRFDDAKDALRVALAEQPAQQEPADTTKIAAQILTYLGFSQDESIHPGADRRRDTVAMMIENASLPSVLAEQPAHQENTLPDFSSIFGGKSTQAEQPVQQEPVGYVIIKNYEQGLWSMRNYEAMIEDGNTPQPAQQELDNSDDLTIAYMAGVQRGKELAQRTWVGLVWGELPEDGHDHDFLRGATWAEAKLKEKNI